MNVNSGTARAKKTAMGNPPTPGQNDQVSTERSSRSKGTVLNEDLQQVQDAKGGRAILEEHQLLVPAGQGLTAHRAAACLFQISQMSGKTPPIVIQAMRGLAFLLEDMEIPLATQTYHDGFGEELATFTNEIRSLVQHAQEKVDLKLEEINKATADLVKTATMSKPHTPNPGTAYSQALMKGQPTFSQILVQSNVATNPKMLARHGIRARQTMLEGLGKDSKISTMGDRDAKDFVNKILQKLEPEGTVRIRSAIKQRNGGLLIEFDADYGAAWIRVADNRSNLCKQLGDDVTTRKRTYELIAMGAPLSAEPEDAEFIKETEEANRVEEGTIVAMRWAKKIARQAVGQKSAHIIFTVNEASEANRLIAMGMFVANKRVKVQKCRTDPVRCLKCQGYNHFAKECTSKYDICGHCGEKGHRTPDCEKTSTHCVSCDSDDHASYDRACPVFMRKSAEKNERTPENKLPFIPTDEPWTWSMDPNDAPTCFPKKDLPRGQSPRWSVEPPASMRKNLPKTPQQSPDPEPSRTDSPKQSSTDEEVEADDGQTR